MGRKLAPVALILLLSLSFTATSLLPAVGQPQQFNPTGKVKAQVDPYSGGTIRPPSGFSYYPTGSAFDPVDHRLYVVNLDGLVNVVDTVTNRSLPEINVGPAQAYNAVYNPVNGEVYISTSSWPNEILAGHVLAINATTDQIIANMTTVPEPQGMCVDTANGKLYVGSVYADYLGVDVYSPSNQFLTSLNLNGSFEDAAYDPANGNVYMVDSNFDRLVMINGTTDMVTGTIVTKYSPFAAVFDSVNNNLYFATFNYEYPGVSPHTRIFGITPMGAQIANFTMFPYFESMFVDSHSGFLYFIGGNFYPSQNISAIDPSTNKVAQSFNTTRWSVLSTYDQGNHLAYLVTDQQYFSVFSPSRFAYVGSVAIFASPQAIAYDSRDGKMFLVSQLQGSNVTLVSAISDQNLTGTLLLGRANPAVPQLIAASTRTGLVYVSPGNGTIVAVNGTSLRVVQTFQAQAPPSAMVYVQSEDSLFLLEGGRLIETHNLASGGTRSSFLSFAAATMIYDQKDDMLILGEENPTSLLSVDPSTLQVVRNSSLDVNGASVFPQFMTLDTTDGLVYISNEALVLAVNATSGQILYFSEPFNSVSGLVYDPSNDYVYALNRGGGASVFYGPVDYYLSFLYVAQEVSCMAFDAANGLLYFGNQFPGLVSVVQPGPPLVAPGIESTTTTVTQVSRVSTTFTEIQTTAITETSVQISTSVQTTTAVTTTNIPPAGLSTLDIGLAAAAVVLGVVAAGLAIMMRRRPR